MAIPQLHTVKLQHLRRFVKPEFLPTHLWVSLDSGSGSLKTENERARASSGADALLGGVNGIEGVDDSGIDRRSPPQTLQFLICPASLYTLEEISAILSSLATFSIASEPYIQIIPVPLHPPTTEEQAQQWSRDYWPTVYKKSNPNGPHPSIVSRAEDSIRPFVGKWMTLAKQAGSEAADNSIGERIGAVVVDPSLEGDPVAVAAAGDARWNDEPTTSREGNGNVMAHAVMRAIGLVARKRRLLLRSPNQPSHSSDLDYDPKSETFLDHPLTPVEISTLSRPSFPPGGYLCTGLEIYMTHEPCVMCSMAILHSRFDKVVFGRRMVRTGGLTADREGGLGYGLSWLEGLNWRLLAWEWVSGEDEGKVEEMEVGEQVHV